MNFKYPITTRDFSIWFYFGRIWIFFSQYYLWLASTSSLLSCVSSTEIIRNVLKHFTGEAVSTDAIRNCMKLLRQWGVIDMYTENKERKIKICPPYDNEMSLNEVCSNIYKFNVDTPLLAMWKGPETFLDGGLLCI